VHVIAPAGPHGTLASDEGIVTWPIVHGGAFGWPGASSRLRARPWRLAGAATFAALASDQIRRLHPDRIVAHWIVPCAHPIVSRGRPTADVEVVAHGADVRLLVSLPAPLRAHVMARVLATASTFRFAARASYLSLATALPVDQRLWLERNARVEPPALSVPDVSHAARCLRALHGPTPLAVSVARLVPSKRVDLAIAAAQRLHPRIRLGVVGDGPDRTRLARLPGGDLVHFEGMIPREQALAWIAAADVLVHTSASEAAPTAVREARLLGTPVVACDAGDVALWAQHDAGIVVVPPDPAAVASAMCHLMN
jgi:glycosyltransferase involved in cell wall biosynthesis